MKKILLILATAALSLGSFAGNPDENKGRKNDPDKYCAELRDGVIKVMHNNEELTADVTLSNGTKIHPDGTITREGGYNRMLKEGECVNMDGQIENSGVPANKSKDKMNKDSDEPLKSKKNDKNGEFNNSNYPDKSGNMEKKGNADRNGSTNMDNGNTNKSGGTNNMDNNNPDKSKSPQSDVEPK
jgi:hypothetical protein